MLHKIFLFVNNNQYSLDVTPYPTAAEAVEAALKTLGHYDDRPMEDRDGMCPFVAEKRAELQERAPQWSNQQWMAYWQSLVQEARDLGILPEEDQLAIEQKEIEISQEPQPYYGFTGSRVGCVDIDSGVMSKEAEQVIRTVANAVVDLEQPEFSFFLVEDDNEMWAEADEVIESGEVILDEVRQAEVKDELRRFRSFLLHNNIWWLRFIGW